MPPSSAPPFALEAGSGPGNHQSLPTAFGRQTRVINSSGRRRLVFAPP